MNSNFLKENFCFDDFFELSPDFMCIASHEGYFIKVNSVLMDSLGYSLGELLTRPIDSFLLSDEKAINFSNADLAVEAIPCLNRECRFITKRGEVISVTWTATPLDQFILAIGKKTIIKNRATEQGTSSYTAADHLWLSRFETVVRKYTRKIDLSLDIICDELAIGERQLFRRTRTIVGVTPNQYVRKIRLQIAMEAIQTGKYRTISEISYAAGFQTPSYFKKLFKHSYNIDIENLL
ncbi:helix-turn-helix domain-containing protein [Pedobacter psychroterrae]|nr:helix-turn-helix domain-containing protein [Pedobacter psychroterrae]